MKNLKSFITASALLLCAAPTFAGLDWTYGALTNADNLERYANSVAYSSSGNIFVSGVEENTLHNTLIVTKKFSATGNLLATVTNSYLITTGKHVFDNCKEVKTDASDNVYVLGKQYASSSRGYDIVLIKYNSSLALQWKKLIYNTNQPTNFNDKPCKILVDMYNNIYVCGTWNNVTATGFTEEIFVQKYSSAGMLVYSTTIPQASGKTIKDVTDMCLDNGLGVAVCARAKDASNVYSIMYARLSNLGNLSWKKFYSPNCTYTSLDSPEIECDPAFGLLYIATIATRQATPTDPYTTTAIVKLNASGIQTWEYLSAETHNGSLGKTLRIDDVANNVYVGRDLGNASNMKHRIIKVSSAGVLQWTHVSVENSSDLNFYTIGSASLIVAYNRDPSGPNQFRYLKKIDCSTGNTIWTESIPFTPPANYGTAYVFFDDLAVNPSTSEAVVTSNLIGYLSGTNDLETRWCIQKYGASSPRLSSTETTSANNENDWRAQAYPNPATDVINVLLPGDFVSGKIDLMDVNGKVIKHEIVGNKTSLHCIPVNDVPAGIYFVQIKSDDVIQSKKIIVQH